MRAGDNRNTPGRRLQHIVTTVIYQAATNNRHCRAAQHKQQFAHGIAHNNVIARPWRNTAGSALHIVMPHAPEYAGIQGEGIDAPPRTHSLPTRFVREPKRWRPL